MCNNATQCFFTELRMQSKSFYANKQSSSSCCNFPMNLCGNLLHMEKLDTVIVHRMMPLYSGYTFSKIFTQAFSDFSLALLSAIFLGVAECCQQDLCAGCMEALLFT